MEEVEVNGEDQMMEEEMMDEEENMEEDDMEEDMTEEEECVSVFSINLDANDCNVNLEETIGVTSIYSEIDNGTTRTIVINNIPSHLVGEFPNRGNPNEIMEIDDAYSMTMTPELANNSTSTGGFVSGVLFSGVGLEVQTAETFVNMYTQEANRDWNIVALQSAQGLGLDCNNAHVQPTGQYHYHGAPSAYVDDLEIDGTEMVKIGYAADGFPIYYKYGYTNGGTEIIAYESGYTLIEGDRPGDGATAPDGCYDGTYSQDYEFSGGTGLDECNGRTGKTPESENEYYYLITENYPSAPICFSGTPDDSFRFAGGGNN